MRHSSPRWPRLALPLGVGGRITTVHARTLDSNGRHLPSSPSRSIRAGIWRCATPRAPRQLPSLTPPDREIQTPEANSRVDKTWGQGQWGLNKWVKEQAANLAANGYVALAVDLYQGKVTADPSEACTLKRGLPEDRAIRDLKAAFDYLTGRPDVDPKH